MRYFTPVFRHASIARLSWSVFMSVCLSFALQASLSLAVSSPAYADIVVRDVTIKIRSGKRPSVAYFTIENQSDIDDALVSVTSDSFERIEMHTNIIENNVVKMRKMKRLALPAQAQHQLKPMGDHLMLFGKSAHLDRVTFTFNFKTAPSVKLIHNINKTKSLDKTNDKHLKMSH